MWTEIAQIPSLKSQNLKIIYFPSCQGNFVAQKDTNKKHLQLITLISLTKITNVFFIRI